MTLNWTRIAQIDDLPEEGDNLNYNKYYYGVPSQKGWEEIRSKTTALLVELFGSNWQFDKDAYEILKTIAPKYVGVPTTVDNREEQMMYLYNILLDYKEVTSNE